MSDEDIVGACTPELSGEFARGGSINELGAVAVRA